MAMRYSKRLAALTPAAGARHVGFDSGFIDEHQAARIKSMLIVFQRLRNRATLSLSCSLAISFFLNVLPSRRRKRQTVS